MGPADTLAHLARHAQECGLPVHVTDITGKAHNPENANLAQDFFALMSKHSELQLPSKAILRTVIRSNVNGDKLDGHSIMEDMVVMMLASKCEWYTLLCRVAQDLKTTKHASHTLVVFGMDDCVPLMPFNKMQVNVSKFEARTLSFHSGTRRVPLTTISDVPRFSDEAVAIIGASCRLPGANNLEEIWKLVSERRDCHQEFPKDRLDPDECFRVYQSGGLNWATTLYGNFIDVLRFDHAFFGINAREAVSMDPQQRLLMELSYEALDSSGYLATHVREHGDPVGCFIGASMLEYLDNTNAHPPTAYTSTGTIRGFLCGRLSHHYGWTGPAEVIDTACSSSLVAIHRACAALRTGECTMALAGGVNAITGINNFMDLGKAGFLSPTGQCKAFDASADGYCRSEGAGLVVLKLLNQAVCDNDMILGVIPGIGTNQGGLSSSLTVPSSSALQALYRTVLRQASLSPSQISYVEAHATGTQVGDPIEMESLRAVFRDSSRSTPLPIGSIKGNIGHCETAAGVAGLLKVLAMIKHDAIPPQACFNTLNPKIPDLARDRLAIPQNLSVWNGPFRAALVNSYGAAGSNCALLCCEMPRDSSPDSQSNVALHLPITLVLSAASASSLCAYARSIADFLSQQNGNLSLSDLAFTLNHRRKRHQFCLEVAALNTQDVVIAFRSAVKPSFESPRRPKPVVLVLGGQNDRHLAISGAFCDAYPAFRYYIDLCDSEITKLGYPSLYPSIFEDEADLEPVSSQCRLFAIQYACASCWKDAGLQVSGIIGHSLGELTALVVSDALSLQDGVKLVAHRARLISTLWGPEKGSMLAVHAASTLVECLISQVQSSLPTSKLEIACYNAAQSAVISGSSESIDAATQILASHSQFTGIRHQRLSTTHAFHSALVDPIIPALDELAEKLEFREPKLQLELCTAEAMQSIRQWSASGHARGPVFFSDAVKRIEQRLGNCIWLEAGLNSCAASLARRATLPEKSHIFQSLDVKNRDDPWAVISDTVTALWRRGVSVKHWNLLSTLPKQVWLPPYVFDGGLHGLQNIDRAMEAHIKCLQRTPSTAGDGSPQPRLLLRLLDHNAAISNHLIDIECERYQKIVGGHIVVGIPLCPASMYMECVVMAIQYVEKDAAIQDLRFEDMVFSAPLGVGSDRTVTIELDGDVGGNDWNFKIQSTFIGGMTVHCVGKASLARNTSLATYSRLLGWPLDTLSSSESAEKLKSSRIYGLFAKVVQYAPFLKSISSIVVNGNEAMAAVKLTEEELHRDQSTAWHRYDAALMDAFISVAGFLLNSSDLVSCEHGMVAVAIERTVVTAALDAQSPNPWHIYTKFASLDEYSATSDVFVYTSQRELVAMFSGVQFTKVTLSRLGKSLSNLDSSANQHSARPAHDVFATSSASSDASSYAPSDDPLVATPVATPESQGKEGPTLRSERELNLRKVLSEYIGTAETTIPLDVELVDLGIDSLSSMDLSSELEKSFGLLIDSFQLGQMTLMALLDRIGESKPDTSIPPREPISSLYYAPAKSTSPAQNLQHVSDQIHRPSPGMNLFDPFEAIAEAESELPKIASRRGFTNYWSQVAPLQNKLLVAYVVEAFTAMGSNIVSLPPGAPISPITYQPKHDRLMKRLWQLLRSQGILEMETTALMRSHAASGMSSSPTLYADFISLYPQYIPEADLMRLIGCKLAPCLQGQLNPVSLMFGDPTSSQIMEAYYGDSPMLSSMTDLLVVFMDRLIQGCKATQENPLRILEVGAGTGGTTLLLANALHSAGIACQYTFTDISPALVSKAASKFSRFPWMTFTVLDLEKDVPHDFRSQFHIIVGTNCVHATSSRTTSCRRLKEALANDGILIISEVTDIIDWYDLCFGLLDGWWLAGNGTEYPLQPSTVWKEAFLEAGFSSFGCSKGSSRESTTQQLLFGSTRSWKTAPAILRSMPSAIDAPCDIETMVYKQKSGICIHADVYIPSVRRTKPLPIGK